MTLIIIPGEKGKGMSLESILNAQKLHQIKDKVKE